MYNIVAGRWRKNNLKLVLIFRPQHKPEQFNVKKTIEISLNMIRMWPCENIDHRTDLLQNETNYNVNTAYSVH
jgi:hypothetical protein